MSQTRSHTHTNHTIIIRSHISPSSVSWVKTSPGSQLPREDRRNACARRIQVSITTELLYSLYIYTLAIRRIRYYNIILLMRDGPLRETHNNIVFLYIYIFSVYFTAFYILYPTAVCNNIIIISRAHDRPSLLQYNIILSGRL